MGSTWVCAGAGPQGWRPHSYSQLLGLALGSSQEGDGELNFPPSEPDLVPNSSDHRPPTSSQLPHMCPFQLPELKAGQDGLQPQQPIPWCQTL